MTFGQKLQAERKLKNMSQETLAEKLGVSRQAVSKWELDASLPDTENVVQLSDLFSVSIDYLLKDTPQEAKQSTSQTENCNTTTACSKNHKRMLILGIIFVAISAIGFCVVWVLEKFYPAPIVNFNTTTQLWRVGLDNFVWVHGLENYMLIIGTLFFAGVGLIFAKQIKTAYLLIKKKFQK